MPNLSGLPNCRSYVRLSPPDAQSVGRCMARYRMPDVVDSSSAHVDKELIIN